MRVHTESQTSNTKATNRRVSFHLEWHKHMSVIGRSGSSADKPWTRLHDCGTERTKGDTSHKLKQAFQSQTTGQHQACIWGRVLMLYSNSRAQWKQGIGKHELKQGCKVAASRINHEAKARLPLFSLQNICFAAGILPPALDSVPDIRWQEVAQEKHIVGRGSFNHDSCN